MSTTRGPVIKEKDLLLSSRQEARPYGKRICKNRDLSHKFCASLQRVVSDVGLISQTWVSVARLIGEYNYPKVQVSIIFRTERVISTENSAENFLT